MALTRQGGARPFIGTLAVLVLVFAPVPGRGSDEAVLASAPLSAQVEPKVQTVEFGRPATFTCTYRGNPVKPVAWFKDGVHLEHKEAVLRIESVGREDKGMYQCIVKNDQEYAQATAELRLGGRFEPPQLTYTFETSTLQPGRSVYLKCVAAGNPTPEITWELYGTRLSNSERMQVGQYVTGNGEVVSHLNISSVLTNDGGQYACVASSAVGSVRHAARLNVYGLPYIRPMDKVAVVAGENMIVHCPVAGYPIDSIIWEKNGRVLPINRRQYPHDNGTLIVKAVERSSDQGRYTCVARNTQGYTARGDLDVQVMEKPRLTAIEPEMTLYVGQTAELRCETSGINPSDVRWTRPNDRLPPNAVVRGNVLRLPLIQVEDSGDYRCEAVLPSGRRSYDVITLIIRKDHCDNIAQQLHSENTRSVELGQSVTMECSLSLPGPISYTWSKRDGKLPLNARTDNSILDIQEVRAEDAGVYVCTSRNNERSIDLPTLLIVTGVVPRFSGNSYLALQTLPRAYLMFDIEISFKPESPDGLILYNSQRAGPDEGDFVAFGVVDGYPEFRFNIGTGPVTITGTEPLEMNQWHTVKLSRNRRNGQMVVNGGKPLTGKSRGRFRGLDLVEPLYLGGVPDFANVHRETGMTTGFRGCISRLVTGNTLSTAFVLSALDRVGITSCQTCNSSPCQNNDVCQEAYNERGHKCFCPAGYLGDLCENTGESCYDASPTSPPTIPPSDGCPVGEFECQNNQCILMTYRCDGITDCKDGSDEREQECTSPTSPPTRPPSDGCPVGEFECQNNQCIPKEYLCDGIPDCEDQSDEREQECIRPTCRADEFTCGDGSCVLLRDRCNGIIRCLDGSDEAGCPPPSNRECSETEFTCTDGSCIEKAWQCDSVPDCLDNSDEDHCCKTSEFRCGDGSCIPDYYRCNSKLDCTDGSDERDNCECGRDEFQCNSGGCVPSQVVCDGTQNCTDGSDERNCSCGPGQFQCNDGQCISDDAHCNGYRDCYDGSDEAGCTTPPTIPTNPVTTPGYCGPDEFQCYSGECLPGYFRCDGRYDCRDDSDETGCPTLATTPATPRPRPPPTRPIPNTFQCPGGPIIDAALRCNSRIDCPDKSDEIGCGGTDTTTQRTYPDQQTIVQRILSELWRPELRRHSSPKRTTGVVPSDG